MDRDDLASAWGRDSTRGGRIELCDQPMERIFELRFVLIVSVFRRPSCQLSFLASVRASEAELPTVDFVGDDALAERGADRFIQALQELMNAFPVTTHERGEHGALIRGDGRSLDRSDPPERDLTTRPGE